MSKSFIFFGFIAAGEEIESEYIIQIRTNHPPYTDISLPDPFGYDKNDLVRLRLRLLSYPLIHHLPRAHSLA